ncbi:MAG: 2-C-methyl-D-erythritol 4-phosphate cytidylyltransferase [Bacteroidales bacterium]|nr:2-C-methyl-D-erythritol 4-phosphate cytidylyltransferase [Bacteroidales bacterium]
MKNRNIAVILAGGVGSRLGKEQPKQFYQMYGKTIIEHTIDAFEQNEGIDEIAVVSNINYISEIHALSKKNNWKKLMKVLPGGKERYESTLAAVNAYMDEPQANLLFHDAVRPLVSQRIINDVLDALKQYSAVNVAVPATDTIIEVDENGHLITQVPNRKYLRRGQSPQGFRQEVIAKAYQLALQDPDFVSTEDCGTVAKYLPQERIYVVEGEEKNMKLTYSRDIYVLEELFKWER